MNDFFDTFITLLDDQSFGWALKHFSLFAKDVSKEEYQGYLGNFLPEIIKERLNKIADKQKYSKNLLYILYRAFFLIHKDAFKTAAALYKDGGKFKNILDDSDDSYDPNWLSDEFMDMEISINKEHQSQSSAASASTNRNDDGASWKQDKQKAKVVEQVIPDIPVLDLDPVVIPQPQVVPQSASSSSLKPMAKPFVFRTKGEKSKAKSNDLGDDATQIITGYHPNPSLGQYVCDILIYDVPAKKSSQRSSSNRQDKPNKLNQDPLSKRTKFSSGSKTGSPATGSNRVPIRSPPKDSTQSSSSNKTGVKNKKSQKMKDKSTGTSLPIKLSKRQLHAEIVKLKTVMMDFIQKLSQN
ncbi:hypothetical protein RCL_jg7864.t1 [Rhizophagus clarus]|uniref:Uncharacterized protein n=1 Tax=Rhizophagus clarus TaxID=94130 RepID=A0A8H3MEA3_9GLOM|nr:hypothetical protein RCL_jg7864.t1 [Rhizophagus clarus]